MPDMYSDAELSDARHIIDWITAQTWSNGRIGMFGTSWGGTASLQTAIDAPEALKAVVAVCATHDRYEDDIHHMGGCLLTDTLEWGATLPTILALPPSPASGDDWMARWKDRLRHLSFPVENWVREEARGTFWRHGSITHQAGRIGCPVLSVGGWSDRYSNSVMSLVDACPDKVWGIVGPWGHHYPDHGHPGPAIGFQQLALEWWDHWLKPDESSAPDWPKLRVWMREFDPPRNAIDRRNGSWVESGPTSAESDIRSFWLCSANRLSETKPQVGSQWTITPDLRHGMASGDTGYFGRFGGLPLAQNEDDDRSLCFETPPLHDEVLLYGASAVTLTLSASARQSQICLRLNDVSPDGVSARVGFAILNLALDEMLDAPEEPETGHPRTVTIRFPTMAYRFQAGHRIRLAIASSYWPLVWPSPQNDEIKLTDGCLDLPIVATQPITLEHSFPAPLDLPKIKTFETICAPDLIRSCETDAEGNVIMRWQQPRMTTRFNDIGTDFSYETLSDHRIHPQKLDSACSLFRHSMWLARHDGEAEVKSELKTTCTAETYELDGKVTVAWQGEPLLERHWKRSVQRHFS
jgi:putative CocE/NonD family hydrolase